MSKRRYLKPASTLLGETVRVTPGERVLLLHVDDPALAREMVRAVQPGGHVIALHTSHRVLSALDMVAGLDVSRAVYPDPAEHGPADVVLLDIPKGREHVQAYLWTAAQALRPGGRLYLAGPNAGGAKTAIKDAALVFGSVPVLAYKGGNRVAMGTRPDSLDLPEAWAESRPWEPQTRTITRPSGDLTVVTMPGVFSWDHLDDGTALLLDHLDVGPEMDVLDIGCGYGIIGLAAAQSGARVTLVDDNLLAVRCARESAIANGLESRCTVLPSDITGAVRGQTFDRVVSNPPFHEEFDVTTTPAERIVRDSFDVLRPGGRLQVVANRFLAYDEPMRATFGNVTTLVHTGQFHVLEAVRSGR